MRIGSTIISLALHVALAWGGVTIAPALVTESEPVPMFDIELVSISEVTNLRPIAAKEVAEEEKPEEPPPPPEPEPVPIPEEVAPPPPPKEPPKPEPKKEEPLDFQKEIERAMKAANSAPAPAKKDEKPKNIFDRGRAGVGTGTADTVTIQHYIMRQILDNGCWGKQTDLADSQTMSATIRVRFSRDGQYGRFTEEPKLMEPTRMPSGGPFLVYVTRAMSGLNKCNAKGFRVPEEYFTVMKSPTIDLRFQPGAD
ncbi:MAG TPA: hypothetical protein VIA80_02035 [Hyphomonadaceae bacterium]|jgi:hypothetical protein